MADKEIEEFAQKIAQQQDAGVRIKRQRLENQQLKEELEVYREKDRLQEAGQVPLSERQKLINEVQPIMKEEQTIPSLSDIIDERKVDMFEATRIQQAMRLKKEDLKVACITAELQKDRLSAPKIDWKEKIKELEVGLANALAVNESHQKLNGKLQERITELENDNKKLAHEIEDRVHKMRKSGL